MNHLEAVAAAMIARLKLQHDVIWRNFDQLREPLILSGSVNFDDAYTELFSEYQIVLDRPKSCRPDQLRLSVRCLGQKHEGLGAGRSISCLVSREIKTIGQQDQYVVRIDYYTLSSAV
jgi:hypothetical protein